MNGFLLVNKEKGHSSNSVVQKIKKNFSVNKVGHLGTLDPDAVGLLIIAINRATKFSSYFLNSDKSYFVEIKLGIITDTDDATGNIIKQCDVNCKQNEVRKEIEGFIGVSMQKPPFFSALKHKGKPLYEYARKGEFINKDFREIEIKEIKNITYKDSICAFEISCSKGTYIRSIARDLGENLGCGGHMLSLKRISQHNFNIKNAFTVNKISMNQLIRIDHAFKNFNKINLNKNDTKKFVNGVRFTNGELRELWKINLNRIYSDRGDFLGIGETKMGYLKHKQLV